MTPPYEPVDAAIAEVEKARKRVSKSTSKQVFKADEIDYLRAVAYAWFRSHRPVIAGRVSDTLLGNVDQCYRRVLDATAKTAARTTYAAALKEAKKFLAAVRGDVVIPRGDAASEVPSPAPDFSSIVADSQMRAILAERWDECVKCVKAGAYLAATVMMGGLLEALFVARANQLSDKSVLFKAKATPMDPSTKKPLPLPQWTLRPYIDVGHEIGWISRSGKDVAAVLRDYRNYVHPEKQRSHGVTLNEHDARMFWDVTSNLTVQLLGLGKKKVV